MSMTASTCAGVPAARRIVEQPGRDVTRAGRLAPQHHARRCTTERFALAGDPLQHGLHVHRTCGPGMVWREPVVGDDRRQALAGQPAADVAVEHAVAVLVACDEAAAVPATIDEVCYFQADTGYTLV